VRGSGQLQHPRVSTAEDFCPLAQRVDMGQYAPTIREELLTFCGQDEAAPNAVEQPEAQFLLKDR
jgi:hypothetical protein